MYQWVQKVGCSKNFRKKDLPGEEYDAMRNLSEAVDGHVHDTADTHNDTYVLNFALEHGEQIYQTMQQLVFMKETPLKPDEKSSEILAEATKMVRSKRSEVEKQKKDSRKHQQTYHQPHRGELGAYNAPKNNYYVTHISYLLRQSQSEDQFHDSSNLTMNTNSIVFINHPRTSCKS